MLKLQFLARIAISYDLADLTAMFTVPAMVSFFVLRDGFFSLAPQRSFSFLCALSSCFTSLALKTEGTLTARVRCAFDTAISPCVPLAASSASSSSEYSESESEEAASPWLVLVSEPPQTPS